MSASIKIVYKKAYRVQGNRMGRLKGMHSGGVVSFVRLPRRQICIHPEKLCLY
jgi:hypothetical protein